MLVCVYFLLTLFAGCKGGADTTQSVLPQDLPPVSNAGSDVELLHPVNSVVLNGSASTDDYGIVQYQWYQVEGGTCSMKGRSTPILTLSNLQLSEYIFRLIVSDAGGQQDDSFIKVRVRRECSEPHITFARQSPLHNGTYKNGDQAQFICEEGYRALHTKASVVHIECSSEGSWVNILDRDGPIPSCESHLTCPLPVIDHGAVLEKSSGSYVAGEHAPIICNSDSGFGGDTPVHTPIIVCQHDGSWTRPNGSHDLPQCKYDETGSCNMPDELEYGKYKILGDRPASGKLPSMSKVLYFCNDGFTLEIDFQGADKPTHEESVLAWCQDGEWLRKPARCVPETTCPKPPEVPHAHFSVYNAKTNAGYSTSEASSDNIVIYFCGDGYRISEEKTMRCEGGVWRGIVPRCVEIGCRNPPAIANGDYSFYNQESKEVNVGVMKEDTQVYYFCHNGYKMKDKNVSLMVCMGGDWKGELPVCEKRSHCDTPMDIPHGNWIFSYLPYPDYRIGSKLIYECEDSYKAIGSTEIECLPSGYWSDYAPKCLPKGEYCSEPGEVRDGFYMCKPNTCELFKVGTEVDYICSKDHEPRPDDIMAQTCLPGGHWSANKPVCAPVLSREAIEELDKEARRGGFSGSTLTVVTATTCSVLGLLVLVLALVILQRHRLRPSLGAPRGGPPPPPYAVDGELPRVVASADQHDRVALIQFADGVQIALPSYEESIHPHNTPSTMSVSSSSSSTAPSHHHHPHHHSRLSSHRPSSLRSGDYRPLPSIPPSLRNNSTAGSTTPSSSSEQRDHHRNSIITTASSNTRDNLSLAFGSMDTVNASDATSTSITIGTYDSSNPSLAMSQRATAGSLASSSTNSLAKEDAPLLERSYSPEPTPPPPVHHDTSVNTPIDEEPEKEDPHL